MRILPSSIRARKGQTPITCLTAYTTPMAAILDPYIDLLLVGDSVVNVLYGATSTREATLDMMIAHGKAVMRGSQKACVIVDMPYGSYEDAPEHALTNAKRIIEETGCNGVKLEGGSDMAPHIALLVDNNIPVMAHVGLTPQSAESMRVQGKDQDSANKIKQDIQDVAYAGAFAVVVEAVPVELSKELTDLVSIPTIGIGASAQCDGQILVTEDILGLTQGKKPKFVKSYANIGDTISRAIQDYAQDVKNREFPSPEFTYNIDIKKAS